MSNQFRHVLLGFLAVCMIQGCDSSQHPQDLSVETEPTHIKETVSETPTQQALNNVAQSAFVQTTELLHLAHQLHIASKTLLATPTPENLDRSRKRYIELLEYWIAATPSIHMTALTNSGAPLINRIEKLPMLPGYVDQIPEYPYSGLIFDIMMPIEKDAVSRLHTQTDDEQVTLGLSAIEFLLFGFNQDSFHQRFEAQSALSKEELEQNITVEQLPNNRRRQLLKLQLDILVEDLSELHKRWQTNDGEDAKKLSALSDNNLKLTISRSYQKAANALLDALNAVQKKEQTLNRASFVRPFKNTDQQLIELSLKSLKDYHQQLRPLWELYPQPEKEEFNAVLNSLDELISQHKATPNDKLTLELATNRSNQLIEIANDLTFSEGQKVNQ